MPCDEEILLFRQRALKVARFRFQRQEDREDFVTYAIITYMQTNRHNLNWLYVDYLRKEKGDTRKGGGRQMIYMEEALRVPEFQWKLELYK